jgi:hypothetical protein
VFGAGVLVLGVASGALPGVGGGGSDAPPVVASQTGVDHAQAGKNATEHAGTQDAGSRRDGLETAAGNVNNPVASTVIGTLIESTPGQGLGEQVAAAATGAASQQAPSTPGEASDGQAHKP